MKFFCLLELNFLQNLVYGHKPCNQTLSSDWYLVLLFTRGSILFESWYYCPVLRYAVVATASASTHLTDHHVQSPLWLTPLEFVCNTPFCSLVCTMVSSCCIPFAPVTFICCNCFKFFELFKHFWPLLQEIHTAALTTINVTKYLHPPIDSSTTIYIFGWNMWCISKSSRKDSWKSYPCSWSHQDQNWM